MLRNLIFGQYVYKKSLIHNLDPRIKIISVVFLSIITFLMKSYYELILITLFVLTIGIISGISIKIILKNLRPFLFVFIFIFLMYFLFSREKLFLGILTIWRFILLIIIASILTFSTTISNLVLGLEKLLLPLRLFKINPRNFALLISITIRFIPLFFMQSMRIRDSIYSRLGSFRKVKHIKIFVISLLERILINASNLSDAIESRLYTGKDASSLKNLNLKFKDLIAFAVVIVVSMFIIY